jgi:hypothetical protein
LTAVKIVMDLCRGRHRMEQGDVTRTLGVCDVICGINVIDSGTDVVEGVVMGGCTVPGARRCHDIKYVHVRRSRKAFVVNQVKM